MDTPLLYLKNIIKVEYVSSPTSESSNDQHLYLDSLFHFYLSTRPINSFPHLKNGSFFSGTVIFSPILRFRPVYDLCCFIKKEHNLRISTRSPFDNASDISLKNRSTVCAASVLIYPAAAYLLFHINRGILSNCSFTGSFHITPSVI